MFATPTGKKALMNRGMTRLILLALVFALLAAACGGDDGSTDSDDPQEPAAQAEGDLDAFCTSVVDAESAIVAGPQAGTAANPEALIEEARTTAPPEIKDSVDVLADTASQALESQDGGLFESDEFRKVDEEVDRFVLENCGFEVAQVHAVDYQFHGLGRRLPAGYVSFDFANGGKEIHELAVLQINEPGVTAEELLKMPQEEASKLATYLGGSFAPPGETDAQTIELRPGEYAIVCFLPKGATSLEDLQTAKGKPHALLGMFHGLTVE